MRTFNRDAFRKGIHIKRTRGNRVFEFTPTNKIAINRQFPQLTVTYHRLLSIHSLRDLDNDIMNMMANLVENSFLNLKPYSIPAIDIIDTYCSDDASFVIYLYDKQENYIGKIKTCAPNSMISQIINSRCKEAEYWSLPGEDTEDGYTYLPKYTKTFIN